MEVTEWVGESVRAVVKKSAIAFGILGNFVILCYNIGEGVEPTAGHLRVGLR